MRTLVKYIYQKLYPFIRFLSAHLFTTFSELYIASKGVRFKDLLSDFIMVTRSLGSFLVLNILVIVVFAFLPQGNDILLIVAEDVGFDYNFWNLLWMLVGLFFWSVVSEFASRYAIYVSDNSGKSISDNRVNWRKHVQEAYHTVFLISPYCVVILYYLIRFINYEASLNFHNLLGYGLPILCVFILLKVVAELYWKKPLKWFALSDQERNWCHKLYGIYNDYIFIIRKPSNYSGEASKLQKQLCDSFLNVSIEERDNFPKDLNKIDKASTVIKDFDLIEFDEEIGSNGAYRWIYRVPNRFYKRLHRQLGFIAGVGFGLYILVSILPNDMYQVFGAPGLLLFSFAGLGSLYILVLFLDYAIFRSYKTKYQTNYKGVLFKILPYISLRSILLLFLILSSFFNKDHPVRNLSQENLRDERPKLFDHFYSWVKNLSLEQDFKMDTSGVKTCPVLFVCAEGGASRTGAYASMLLSTLQENYSHKQNVDFKKSIYAFSGVSGGSLGLSFFNSRAYYSSSKNSLVEDTKAFFQCDFLAPIIGKMFYGDLLNLFLPFQFEVYDRAIALEKSWENCYGSNFPNEYNLFSSAYLRNYNAKHLYPAMFINTTEVETGNQCWLSNVRTDKNMYLSEGRDLFVRSLSNSNIAFSTMINFSTRFPLLSPAAAVVEKDLPKKHYADGGYIENTGAGTMKEILVALEPTIKTLRTKDSIQIEPYVIMIRFGNDNGKVSTINFANEVSEVIYGIYNTRSGRSNKAVDELKKYIETEHKDHFINLSLDMDGREVPLNWVLSKHSLNNLKEEVDNKWKNRDKNELRKLPWR